MKDYQKNQFNDFLEELTFSLDISESLYQKVEERYKSISSWLGRDRSTLLKYNPNIFPQGSIQLGTVVKPVNDSDDYDVDLVCELQLSKSVLSQEALKLLVGHEIKGYAVANNFNSPVEEGRRCWTLEYSDSAQFHTDILPAIPDGKTLQLELYSKNISNDLSKHAIAITDKKHPNYTKVDSYWYQSNPKGYALWFREQMKVQFALFKDKFATKNEAKISDIPDYKVKTPLQRAVQLLKRHRDIMFEKDTENKPISIIITTLAAHAYRNEANIVDALTSIINGMPNYLIPKNGGVWIPNPVNPLENFADKWTEHPQKERNFRNWLEAVRTDFLTAFATDNLESFSKILAPRMGRRFVESSLQKLSKTSSLQINKTVAPILSAKNLFDVSHRQRPRWPVQITGKVEIVAWAERNGFRPWQFSSNSKKLPKRCSLKFEAKTNISSPYKVYWQIVNTGGDATIRNCLRGYFENGILEKGGLEKRESTLYTGMHWIECFIVKDEKLVARSGEYVVNIE